MAPSNSERIEMGERPPLRGDPLGIPKKFRRYEMNKIVHVIAGSSASTSDESKQRSERFLKRVDAYLIKLSLEAKRTFLRKQIAIWQGRYNKFVMTDGMSESGYACVDPPHATDFVNTILGLAIRLSAKEGGVKVK
jgi:hypothetical protein